MPRAICLIANRNSGTNARDKEAIERALEALGGGAWVARWSASEPIEDLVARVIDEDGADMIVSAGGDGTAMAVAGALLGRDVPMGVLPLGTFNYFARGLGLSEDVAEAAAQIAQGRTHRIRVGEVNGQVFLNNASLGIYPAILKEREAVYARWGRSRPAAYWSVARVFWRFRKALAVRITADGEAMTRRTALVFVARSAYQLESFGFEGETAIENDRFAVLIAKAHRRRDLIRIIWRLVAEKPMKGRDYDLVSARKLVIETTSDRQLVAFDGEKARMQGPFTFVMNEAPLTIILPETRA